MKRNFTLLIIFVLTVLSVLACVSKKNQRNQLDAEVSKSPEIQNALIYLAENLDLATFAPIRVGWQYDYGFKNGWLLNKYEYLRSLLTYKDFQAKLKYSIYLSGPHTTENLDLNSKYSFGHYNPEFVAQLRNSALLIMSKEGFVSNTKPLLEKYNILEFLREHKNIYEIAKEHPDEFNRIKMDFIKGIQDETWSEGAYRTELPALLNSGYYWNWSETSYHFWIRRDIDNTKDIWAGLIADVLNAYDY